MAVGMGHQLIGLLGRGVEADGVVGLSSTENGSLVLAP